VIPDVDVYTKTQNHRKTLWKTSKKCKKTKPVVPQRKNTIYSNINDMGAGFLQLACQRQLTHLPPVSYAAEYTVPHHNVYKKSDGINFFDKTVFVKISWNFNSHTHDVICPLHVWSAVHVRARLPVSSYPVCKILVALNKMKLFLSLMRCTICKNYLISESFFETVQFVKLLAVITFQTI